MLTSRHSPCSNQPNRALVRCPAFPAAACHAYTDFWARPDEEVYRVWLQLLREAASRGGQMAHAAGTSPPPPTAPLGASGAETIKEFEVRAHTHRTPVPPRHT